MQTNQQKRGPGFWKLNTSLLQDEEYCTSVMEIIRKNKQKSFAGIPEKWDFIKTKIRGFTIQYSTRKKRSRENIVKALDRKIQYWEEELLATLETPDNPIANLRLTIKQIEKRIQELEKDKQKHVNYKIQGAMTRAHRQWLKDGGKNTKYFLRLESSNYKRKNRYQIRVNNKLVIDNQEILKEQDNFYRKLYRSRNIQISPKYLNSLTMPKLTNKQKEQLDADITPAEIKTALFSMKTGKVPGTEGFPPEFYQKFWDEIQAIVTQIILLAA